MGQLLVAVQVVVAVPAHDDALVSVNTTVPEAEVLESKFPENVATVPEPSCLNAPAEIGIVVVWVSVPSTVQVPLPKLFRKVPSMM